MMSQINCIDDSKSIKNNKSKYHYKIGERKQRNHFTKTKCKNTERKGKKRRRSFLIVHFVYLNSHPIADLTLKISNKNN